jgi:plasmid maintenance system antidote protein VapI
LSGGEVRASIARCLAPETALRLGIHFGTGPDLWLTMQAKYDLRLLQRDRALASFRLARMKSVAIEAMIPAY